MPSKTETLRELDKKHLWHPFTQMQDWCDSKEDPIIIASGQGATLTDSEGNEYFDGNSSIWTNVHGHNHPVINEAIRNQLEQISHCSALGFSNEPAIRLAERLTSLFPEETLTRVFFSDDGSTAIECACKMAVQYRQLVGGETKSRFLAFDGAYHGDTVGAASLGKIGVFNDRFSTPGYETVHLSSIDELDQVDEATAATVNAVILEPLIQGAGGMKTWPAGMLRTLRDWCDRNDAFLILDEVMTGFGRTGKLFACEQEEVVPDFLCLAKGLTGGYLPLAATLTTEKVYSAFLGRYEELKTFFYGHSYCANPLGCAAALGSLDVFDQENVIDGLDEKIIHFRRELQSAVQATDCFGELRQVGLIAGIDVVNPASGEPYNWKDETGAKICRLARSYGLLTRPVRDTLTLMPPLCATKEEITHAVDALSRAANDYSFSSGSLT